MKFLGRKRLRTCLSMLLIATCLLASFSFCQIGVKAATTIKLGIVDVSSNLKLRSGPGTEYPIVSYLYDGNMGVIHEEASSSSGSAWYKMTIKGVTGWAAATYVDIKNVVLEEDQSFEAYLQQQGFPESYKQPLRILHALYPNWVFEAQNTNLDWNNVIAAESALGKNLVSKDSISSWKSTQSGAYNWETKEWVIFDSGGWVMASEEMIKSCMDPRNFLDVTNIFQFIKQSYSPSPELTARKKEDLIRMVNGTYLDGVCEGKTYVDLIMEVAEGTGVCPLTLASMMIQEQGADGKGGGISGTNPTFPNTYNYFNIGAYKDSNLGLEAVERGLWYARGAGKGYTSYYRPWVTRTAAIWGGASYYGTNYVNVGQDTMYLKKFNVQGPDIYNHQYMTNVQGAISEGRHVSEAYDENARNASLIFKIPVYNNMPDSFCPIPVGNDTPIGGSEGGTTSISITSSAYSVNGNSTITGIGDFSIANVSTFLDKFSVSGGEKKVTTSGSVEKTGDSKIGTGDQLRVINGSNVQIYNIIVYGDTNGDGGITSLDLLRVQKHILNIGKLSGVYENAADTSKNGTVNSLDLLQVQKHILNIKAIGQ